MTTRPTPDEALDQVMVRTLVPPALPAGFRTRLQAAMARSGADDLATRRAMLERERREQLAVFRGDTVRLRRQTIAALLGGAFVGGVVVTAALPWIRATFGAHSGLVLPLVGAGIALLVGAATWARRAGVPQWLS